MKEYVNFACTHIADADQSMPDERLAFAYADIDGYLEDAEGAVICRVWMLKEKQGIYPAYLVNWNYNAYRVNKSVLELITQAKENLRKYRQQMMDDLFQKAYSRYKLEWLTRNGYTVEMLMEKLQCKLTVQDPLYRLHSTVLNRISGAMATDGIAKRHSVRTSGKTAIA